MYADQPGKRAVYRVSLRRGAGFYFDGCYEEMIETRPYDVQNYLATPEDRAAYLEAALEDGDTEVIATALGEIARAIGVGELARRSGVSRETIYK